MARLVQLLNNEDPELRLNALWAFKNLMYKGTPEQKRQAMSSIGWANMNKYVSPSRVRIHSSIPAVCFWMGTSESASKRFTSFET